MARTNRKGRNHLLIKTAGATEGFRKLKGKMSYYAVQNVVSVFNDAVELIPGKEHKAKSIYGLPIVLSNVEWDGFVLLQNSIFLVHYWLFRTCPSCDPVKKTNRGFHGLRRFLVGWRPALSIAEWVAPPILLSYFDS